MTRAMRSVTSSIWIGPLAVLALLASVTPGTSQTNDTAFQTWEWTEPAVAPRLAGLSRAFVAVADDAAASLTNPAGLVSLPSVGELQVTPYATVQPHFSKDGSQWFPFAALTINRDRRNAVGIHYYRMPVEYGPKDGSLKTMLVNGGLSYARRIKRATFGLGVAAEQVRLDSRVEDAEADVVELRDRGRTRLLGSLGVLWQPRGNTRAGDLAVGAALRYRRGPSGFTRTAYNANSLHLDEAPKTENL